MLILSLQTNEPSFMPTNIFQYKKILRYVQLFVNKINVSIDIRFMSVQNFTKVTKTKAYIFL